MDYPQLLSTCKPNTYTDTGHLRRALPFRNMPAHSRGERCVAKRALPARKFSDEEGHGG